MKKEIITKKHQLINPLFVGLITAGLVVFTAYAGCFISATKSCSSAQICWAGTPACPLSPAQCCTPPTVTYTDVDNAPCGAGGLDSLAYAGTYTCIQTCNVPHPCTGIGSFPMTRTTGPFDVHVPSGTACAGTAGCGGYY